MGDVLGELVRALRLLGVVALSIWVAGCSTSQEAIEQIRLLSPTGERVALAQVCQISVVDGANEIYREGNSRYVAIKYSVRGRDLGSTVEEAIQKVNANVKLPVGYTYDWAGEYESQKRHEHHSVFKERAATFILPIRNRFATVLEAQFEKLVLHSKETPRLTTHAWSTCVKS